MSKLIIPANIRPLGGHINSDTAYVVQDYPYGGLRTQMKYWVDSRDGFGERVVSQSLNPKNVRWNKPHPGCYSQLICLYLNNENGHIEHAHLSQYESKADMDLWETTFAPVLTDWQKARLKGLRKFLENKSPSSYFDFSAPQWEAYKVAMAALNAEIEPKIALAKAAGEKLPLEVRNDYNEKRRAIVAQVLLL